MCVCVCVCMHAHVVGPWRESNSLLCCVEAVYYQCTTGALVWWSWRESNPRFFNAIEVYCHCTTAPVCVCVCPHPELNWTPALRRRRTQPCVRAENVCGEVGAAAGLEPALPGSQPGVLTNDTTRRSPHGESNSTPELRRLGAQPLREGERERKEKGGADRI